ncbi:MULTISPECIES: GspE/PulE family protein [Janthinobacterium]|jgi:MSHA biogenesis protein MshE|uniref:Flp pilus assembly complex ATPase component TadA n=2 Tax=Janthinobacterium TaxID=29580 RepID=A0AAJ4T3R3_9BURK|nr:MULTISPECIES: GspE/PulE family protein [Janthinobacterium]AQR70013.1 MSHA biogenesis protein MshE [Janthinobacterium sp. LM6]KAB0325608.1 MSHA biogenesis protein MshE [Janthinobacterium lividum]KHA79392.1 MSHA biogenesis protein MshE [Janthinobacterium lividum]MBR7635047.1 Flp pilus assembly complex ATPase component TadA [Janthinobacterium lividum]MCM2564295.1 GspE/PulE family protein [Janthinobacterium kumbetense]
MARPEKVRLGEILVQQKLLTEEQLGQALTEQKRSGRKLGRVFVEHGFVTEEQISGALARQLDIPYINLKFFNINPELVRLLPETQARRFRALVLEDRREGLLVGMSDPTDLFAYDEISRLVKRHIELAVVNETEVLAAIDRIYRRTEDISTLTRELEQDLGDVSVDFGALAANPGLEEAPIVKLLQSVFEDATQVRASDIHIEPQEGRLQIRFRIDGVLHLQTEADSKIASSLALRLKLMSDLDISEKRLPQDGRFAIRVKNQRIDVRISTMPTQYGESVVMRLLNQGGTTLRLDAIGMPPALVAQFRAIVSRPNGLVLVTGPTGSGKTTTLYCALSELNSVEKKLITVEDPVEYRLPGINQVQVNDKIELNFARVLRSALRQDPDIVLVGEMRDQETAQIGLRAAMTGHLVLSTLHTNDAISTPLRLMDMGVPRYMVGSSLQAVLAQRLVRVICESCSTPYAPTPNEYEWLRLELGELVERNQYFHGKGCSHCNGMGYRGRTGVYELLEITRAVADAANHADPSHFMKVATAQMAGETLRRHAVQLVVQGRTTVMEAMRISNQSED